MSMIFKKFAMLVICCVLITSCSTRQINKSEELEYRGYCGELGSDWQYHYISERARDKFYKLVNQYNKEFDKNFRFPVESWFAGKGSNILLCRTNGSPTSKKVTTFWWHFGLTQSGWEIVNTGGAFWLEE
jgi:hypothetical protein